MRALIILILAFTTSAFAHESDEHSYGAVIERLDRMEQREQRDRMMSRARAHDREEERLYEQGRRDFQHMLIRDDMRNR